MMVKMIINIILTISIKYYITFDNKIRTTSNSSLFKNEVMISFYSFCHFLFENLFQMPFCSLHPSWQEEDNLYKYVADDLRDKKTISSMHRNALIMNA